MFFWKFSQEGAEDEIQLRDCEVKLFIDDAQK